MNMMTIEERVQAGAAWLDERYPGWFQVIDLGTLDISRCDLCVLGQVYTGCVPAHEKDQLLAQAAQVFKERNQLWAVEKISAGTVGGFIVMAETVFDGDVSHTSTIPLGFAVGLGVYHEYAELLDAWTQLIIQRRLDAQPETKARIEEFLADPSTGVRRERPPRRLVSA